MFKYSGIKLSYEQEITSLRLYVEIFRRIAHKGGPAFVDSKVSFEKCPIEHNN